MKVKESSKHYQRKILEHDGVTYRKESSSRYLVTFEGKTWRLWPSGNFQEFEPGKPDHPKFFGEMKRFYHQHITKTLDLPENFGKIWTEGDVRDLIDMVEEGLSVNQVAHELARHPDTIVSLLKDYIDAEHLSLIAEDQYDVAINELFPTL